MRHSRIFLFLMVATAFAVSPACGGGGSGFGVVIDPLVITGSTIDPTLRSGDEIDWEIPLGGGCSGSGPFVVEVIAGVLPDGVGTDQENGRHHLVGVILEDGLFVFTVKVTDTSCVPFATTTMEYTWDVQQGPVRIVGAVPAVTPWASFDDGLKYGTALEPVDALKTVVYGSFTNIDLIAAGGVGPYVCEIIDSDDPNDGGLPLGASLAPGSCSIVGTPTAVGPGGRPFLITFRVTDSVGNTSERKFQWKIDTPPIIFATTSWLDGQAGKNYSDSLTAIDGVPPLGFELLDNVPGDDLDPDTTDNVNDDVTYNAGLPPTINSFVNPALTFQPTVTGPAGNNARLIVAGGRVGYPTATQVGPYEPFPSEGLYFRELGTGAGGMFGVPRRAGQYTTNVHVYSTLVPNERGQHAFRQLPMTVNPPDTLIIDPILATTGINPVNGYPTLPEASATVLYNPDAANGGEWAADGLLLNASGGVPFDNEGDAPHEADLPVAPPTPERDGKYTWTDDMNFDGLGAWGSTPNAMSVFDPFGSFGTGTSAGVGQTNANALYKVKLRQLELTVTDHALPNGGPGNLRQTVSQPFNLGVGPDTAIIAYSTTSVTESDFWWNSSNRFRLNENALKIMKFAFFGTTPSRKELEPSDMAATHSVPGIAGITASNEIGALLSGVTVEGVTPTGGGANMDLLRCVVNATGWWDDMFQMNPKGARPFTHADANRTDGLYGGYGSSWSNQGNFQPTTSAVDLPDAPSVTHNPGSGIYADGGLCYHFESSEQYGIFIVRPDTKIYVPFAEAKPTPNSSGFGDGVLFDNASNQHGALRTVQMTVSPDGRFGAMKLLDDQTNLFEHADNTRILVFSLTGEKCFGESVPGANDGDTYRIVSVDATTLTGGGNRILYASSMALTQDYLYCLIGTQSPPSHSSTSSSYMYYQTWRGHHIMRMPIKSGSLAKLTSTDVNWTNDDSASTTMQTVFHHHGPNASSSSTYWGLIETTTSYGRWPYHRYWQEDGMNFHEHNVAPAPFRVSANGRAVAFFAAQDYTGTSSTLVYSTYCWVDYDGGGATRVSSLRRHHAQGSGRGYTTYFGPAEYANFGRYHGPTPGVEISDDGMAVAFNYNRASTITASASYSSSSNRWPDYREDVILTRSTSGTWGAFGESEVTRNCFGGSHFWRFGCFTFTEDGDGLAFWGGAPTQYSATSTYYRNYSTHFHGCFYLYLLGDTDKVTSMQALTEGGSPDGEGKVYTATSKFAPTSTTGKNNRFGATHPCGGFLSKNRKFLYICSVGAISSSEATACKLVGFQIATPDGASINGKLAGRAFVPGNWPSRRGFTKYYYYYYGNSFGRFGYAPSHAQGLGYSEMAKDTGWVFFAGERQKSGPSNSSSTSYGGFAYPTYYNFAENGGGIGVYGFDADVGGNIASLHQPAWAPSSTAVWELNKYLEVSRDGKRLMQVRTVNTSNWEQTYYHNRERVRLYQNIDFHPTTGALVGYNPSNDAKDLETANGRVSSSVAVINDSDTVFYARGPTGNENTKVMTSQQWDAGASAFVKKAATGLAGWYEVLWAGR